MGTKGLFAPPTPAGQDKLRRKKEFLARPNCKTFLDVNVIFLAWEFADWNYRRNPTKELEIFA